MPFRRPLAFPNASLLSDEDELESAALRAAERFTKNNTDKARKPGYRAFDDDYDEDGNFRKKSILSQYDEEIDGPARASFRLGSGGRVEDQPSEEEVAAKLKGGAVSLEMNSTFLAFGSSSAPYSHSPRSLPEMQQIREYYTEAEVTQFKRPAKAVRPFTHPYPNMS